MLVAILRKYQGTMTQEEYAALLGIFSHRHADTILDAAERIEKLALEQNRGVESCGDLVEFDQWCATDGFDDVVIDSAHNDRRMIVYVPDGSFGGR